MEGLASNDMNAQEKKTLGRNLLIGGSLLFGASVLGGMAGGGISADLLVTRALTIALAGAIIYGVIRGFQALK